MAQKKKPHTPKYQFNMLEVLEQSCAAWRVEPNFYAANRKLRYLYTKEEKYNQPENELPTVTDIDKQLAQDAIEYFKRLMFNAIAGTLTPDQKAIYKAINKDVILYGNLKGIFIAPYLYAQMLKDDWVDDIIQSRLSGKVYSKKDSPIIKKCLIISVKLVKSLQYGDFFAYLGITEDDHFVQFTSSAQEPIAAETEEINIRAGWKGVDVEWRTKLPITKLFRVKKI
jgi:hypothetical protein